MSVTGSLQKKHGRWYIYLNLYDKDGRRHQKAIDTKIPIKGSAKREREKMLNDTLAEYSNNCVCYMDNLLFCDYIKEWLENHKPNIQQSTFESYEKVVDSIYTYFKTKRINLQDLTHHDIKAFYKTLRDKGNTENTIRKYHANIRKCLQDAMREEMVSRNVADLVKLPKIEKYVAKYYNSTQAKKFLEAVKGDIVETAMMLAIYYGLRRSEVCGLMWRSVDLDNRTIQIITTKVKQKTVIVKDRTKNQSSYRTLPMDDKIYHHLKRLQTKQKADKLAFGNTYYDSDFVIKREDGKPINMDFLTKSVKVFAGKAGLHPIRFHDLRHSCASLLVADGIDLKHVQSWLGHSDIRTTSETYTHLEFAHKQNIASAMSNILFQGVTRSVTKKVKQ